MMVLILLRMIVTLGVVAVAFVGGPALYLIDGDMSRAGSLLFGCALVAWVACPNNEDQRAFDEFQRARMDQ